MTLAIGQYYYSELSEVEILQHLSQPECVCVCVIVKSMHVCREIMGYILIYLEILGDSVAASSYLSRSSK